MDDRDWFGISIQGSLKLTQFATEEDARHWVENSGVWGCTNCEVVRFVAPPLTPGSPSEPVETIVGTFFRHANRCHHYPINPEWAVADSGWRL